MPNGDMMSQDRFQQYVVDGLDNLKQNVSEVKDTFREFKREHKNDISKIYDVQRNCRGQVDKKFEVFNVTVGDLLENRGSNTILQKLVMVGLGAVISIAAVSLVTYLYRAFKEGMG